MQEENNTTQGVEATFFLSRKLLLLQALQLRVAGTYTFDIMRSETHL